MNWKSLAFALSLAVAPLLPAQQGAEPPAYEVLATSRGHLVAWPAGMFEKPDVMTFAEKADAELAASGSVSAQVLGELTAKAESSAPNGKEQGGRHTPFRNKYRPHMRTVLIQLGEACRTSERACYNSSGAPCREGEPGCRCGCVNPNVPASDLALATRNRRAGVPLILLAPEGADLAAAARAAVQTLGRNGYYFKF